MDKDDAISTRKYVLQQCSRNEDQNRIIMYKARGDDFTVGDTSELSKHPNYAEMFCLALQTKEQSQMLSKFGGKILCADATHGLTKYGYQLVSVVVKEDQGKGYPVSHLITSNVDSIVLTAYFKELQKRNPTLKVKFAMSDDDNATRKAFKDAFGEDVRTMFCYWHLREAWKRNLKRIKDLVARDIINSLLKATLTARREEEYKEILHLLKTLFPNCEDFMQYFESYYLPKDEDWARCHRNFYHDGVDTNMLLESFHNLIKTVYLLRKQNWRVDTLLVLLSDIEVDFWLRYTIATLVNTDTKDDPDKSKRHTRGMGISDSKVTQVNLSYL